MFLKINWEVTKARGMSSLVYRDYSYTLCSVCWYQVYPDPGSGQAEAPSPQPTILVYSLSWEDRQMVKSLTDRLRKNIRVEGTVSKSSSLHSSSYI